MNTMRKQLEALMRLCTAEQESERQAAKAQVLEMLKDCRQEADPESAVRNILLDLGAPDHLLGHAYMVEALLMCLEDRMYINNITFGLYPQIAAKFDTTAARVERALRHLIEVTWERSDMDALRKYFGNTIRMDKGKPTNGEFLARITNVVHQQLKTSA